MEVKRLLVYGTGTMDKSIGMVTDRKFTKYDRSWTREAMNNLFRLSTLGYDKNNWEIF